MPISDQRQGQLACIAAVERAMGELERAVIITGIGAEEFNAMRLNLVILRTRTQDHRTVAAMTREERDIQRGVMRPPRYRGD